VQGVPEVLAVLVPAVLVLKVPGVLVPKAAPGGTCRARPDRRGGTEAPLH